jgi:sulfate/thiosulfate transport system ATP-binding protein
MTIDLIRIVKRYGAFAALDSVDLTVRSGEVLALLGPSGSGKTTLLRMIAGLDMPDSGRLLLQGEDATARSARDRRVGFVFQHYALFRHMTVFENVAFGLRVRPRSARPSHDEIRERVARLLALVHIDTLHDRYPSQLSGGQRQRVALARALAIEPKVLLLDEPFGALDARVRKELRRWLRRLQDEIKMTTVFVTHDQEEAFEVADRVAVMNRGRIEQIGPPQEVYDNPANAFVYQFLGEVNRLPLQRQGGGLTSPGIDLTSLDASARKDGVAYVRPHEIVLTPNPAGLGVVRFAAAAGPLVRVEVETEPSAPTIEVELTPDRFRHLQIAVGSRVDVVATAGRIMPPEDDGRTKL